MEKIEWIDGWTDDPAEGERNMVAVADEVRHPIPPELWIQGRLKPGVRISFTLRKKRKNWRPSVDKVILRP